MVCCLFYLILFIPVNIFLVKSCQDGSFLGWTGTKQDLMFLACHVYFLQPCGHQLGKGWPLGSLVCDVFLFVFFVTFPYHTMSWVMCGTWLYRFLAFAFFFTLLKDNMQLHLWDSNPQPFYLDSSTLPHGTALAYFVVIPMKVLDYCYDLGAKGLGQIYLTKVDVNSFLIFVRYIKMKVSGHQYDRGLKGRGIKNLSYGSQHELLCSLIEVLSIQMTFKYYQVVWLLVPLLLLFRWRLFIFATVFVWGI